VCGHFKHPCVSKATFAPQGDTQSQSSVFLLASDFLFFDCPPFCSACSSSLKYSSAISRYSSRSQLRQTVARDSRHYTEHSLLCGIVVFLCLGCPRVHCEARYLSLFAADTSATSLWSKRHVFVFITSKNPTLLSVLQWRTTIKKTEISGQHEFLRASISMCV